MAPGSEAWLNRRVRVEGIRARRCAAYRPVLRAVARVCLASALLLALAVDAATAGAGRTRPGGSGGSPPARASGQATYGHGGGGHGGYPPGHGGGWGWGWHHRYPFYGYAAWPWGWWYAGGPWVGGPGGIDPRAPGAIETDVTPKKAEIYVDGGFVGQPRDYNGRWELLWLEPGEHLIEFRKEGYRTLRRQVDLGPGAHLLIEAEMQKGQGLDPRSTEVPHPPVARAAPETPTTTREDRGTLRRGLLRLGVEPSDAAVYLDGEFLAHGNELSRLHGALPVAQGPHRIEVVRPGFESRSVEVDVAGDAPVDVEIRLERE